MKDAISYLATDTDMRIVKSLLGNQDGFKFFEFNHKNVVVTQTSYSRHVEKLSKLAEDLREAGWVQAICVHEPDRFTLTPSGQLYIQHKALHDYYIIDFGGKSMTFCGKSEIAKIVLVGEGNGVRLVRRHLKRHISDGNVFFSVKKLHDLQKLIKSRYAIDVLAVMKSGYVMNMRTMELVEHTGSVSTEMERAYYNYEQVHAASGIVRAAPRDAIVLQLDRLDDLEKFEEAKRLSLAGIQGPTGIAG